MANDLHLEYTKKSYNAIIRKHSITTGQKTWTYTSQRYMNGQYAHTKGLNIIIRDMHTKTLMRYHFKL